MANIPVTAATIVGAFILFAGVIAGATYGISLANEASPIHITPVDPILVATAGNTLDVAFVAENTGSARGSFDFVLEGPAGFVSGDAAKVDLGAGERAGRFITLDVPATAKPGSYRVSIVPSEGDSRYLALPIVVKVIAPTNDVVDGKTVNISVSARSGDTVILSTREALSKGAFTLHSDFQPPQKFQPIELNFPLGPPFDVAFNDLAGASIGESRSVDVPANAIWRNTVTLDETFPLTREVALSGTTARDAIPTNKTVLRNFLDQNGNNATIEDGLEVEIPNRGKFTVELGSGSNLTLRERAVVGEPLPRAPATRIGASWTTRVTAITATEFQYVRVPPAEGSKFTFLGDPNLGALKDRATVGPTDNGNTTITFDVTVGDTFADATTGVAYEVRDVSPSVFQLYAETKSPFANLPTHWMFTIQSVR